MFYNTAQITELAHFVLGIDLKALTGNVASTSQYPPIAPKADNFADFYNQYQPLILDEVMATLQTAVSKFEPKNKVKVELQEKDRVKYYPQENVTMLHLANDNRIQCDDLGSFSFIVGIANINSTRVIAILNIFVKEYQIVLNGDFSNAIQSVAHFEFSPLASLVNIDRMYNVCVQKPENALLNKIMRASVSPWPVTNNNIALPASAGHLNAEQKQAVDGFIQGEDGVYLLQGPPGTGKTTTIVSLIQQLAQKNEHILVCAPSNKAIQVLAKKTLEAMPHASLLLIAVESKVSTPGLQEISYDNWDKRYPGKLKALLPEIDIAPYLSRKRFEATSPNDIIDTQTFIKFIQDVTNKSKAIAEILKSCARYAIAMNPAECQNLIQLANNELEKYLNNLIKLQQNLSVYTFPALPGKQAEPVFTKEKLAEIDQFIMHICNQYNSLHSFISYDLLKYFPVDQKQLFARTQILFCTLSITGRMSLRRLSENQDWSFQTVILDEAGQAVESEELIPFHLAINATKALIVGDTRQLPATTIGVTAKDTHFDHSMMWRLLEENKQPFHSLMVQYRMKENIRHFPSNRYYDGKLIDHESIATRPSNLPMHMKPRTGIKFWVDIPGQEERTGLSYYNRKEAESIVTLIAEIRKSDTKSHIGVISFYNAQVNAIRSMLKHERTRNPRLDPETITVHSVDGFQGDEKDIIIVSFVRANQQSFIGFLSDFRRLNVAITRAKDILYIFGSASTFRRATGTEIHGLLDYLTKAGAVKSFNEVMLHVANRSINLTPTPVSLPVVTPLQNITASVYRPVKANKVSGLQKFEFYTADELIAQAKRYFIKMKYELAIENYSHVLKLNHQHRQVYFLIAECYDMIGNKIQAQLMADIGNSLPADITLAAQATSMHQVTNSNNAPRPLPTHTKKPTLKNARDLCDESKFIEAEAIYMELLDDAPEDPEVLLGLGWTLNKQKRHKEALRYFEISIAFSKTPLGYQGVIRCLSLLNQFDRALDYVYEGLEYFPWSKTLAAFKANIETRIGPKKVVQPPTGKSVIIGFKPQSAAIVQVKTPTATSANQTINQSSSSSSANASTKLSEVDQANFIRARMISNDLRDSGSASIILKKLLERYPNNVNVLNELGWCMHVLRHNSDAVGYFKKSLKIEHTYVAYYSLARCYKFLGHFELAVKTINEGLKHFPRSDKLLDYKKELESNQHSESNKPKKK